MFRSTTINRYVFLLRPRALNTLASLCAISGLRVGVKLIRILVNSVRRIANIRHALTRPHVAFWNQFTVLQELRNKKEEVELKKADKEELRAAKGISAYLDYMCS